MSPGTDCSVSVILPCKNEAETLRGLLPSIRASLPEAQILVVDDGSSDDSVAVCRQHRVEVVSHPYSMGNGAAIKSGARCSTGSILVFMDADGQHDPAALPGLIAPLAQGYDMVVGARATKFQASLFRRIANGIYNRFASMMTGYPIKDLTSGFRAVRRNHFLKFLYLLPNGFSYPTTITMAFFRSALPVGYVPIETSPRKGKSHIRPLRDGLRFFVIILKIGALFSPMRLFVPISGLFFVTAIGYYAYTYLAYHAFSNMSALLFICALFTFLIGLLAEQVSSLHYKGIDDYPEDARR